LSSLFAIVPLKEPGMPERASREQFQITRIDEDASEATWPQSPTRRCPGPKSSFPIRESRISNEIKTTMVRQMKIEGGTLDDCISELNLLARSSVPWQKA